MSRQITQEMAEKIRDKLCGGAKPKTTGGHDVYAIRYAGQVVGKISIRRSSKQIGHDYIPGDINVTMHFAKEVGQCTKYFDDYIQCLRDKGLIAREDDEAELPAPTETRKPWEKDWVAIQEAESRAAVSPDALPKPSNGDSGI